MRILVISNLFPPRVRGGYEIACFNLSNALRRRGHEVRVLTTDTTSPLPSTSEPFVDRSMTLRRFQEIPASDPSIFAFLDHESLVSNIHNTSELLIELREFRPDHVLAFNLLGLGGLAMIDLLNSVGAPWTFNLGDRVPSIMLDTTDEEIAELFGARNGANYKRAQVAAISQTVVDEARDDGIDLGPRVRIISRGVIPHDQQRTRPYREDGVTKFVFASTVGAPKGMDIAIDAIEILAGAGYRKRFRLDVYGNGQVEQYRELVAERGLSDVIEFHGPVPQKSLLAIESGADAFLFPTWEREALGNSPLEAASVGCVPIMTSTCGAAERLVDGTHTIKVPRKAEDFASAMASVIQGKVDLEKMGAAGMRLAKGALSMETSVKLLEEFLLEGNRPGWADENLDSPEIGAEVIRKDHASVEMLYAKIEEALEEAPGTRRIDMRRTQRA